MPLSGCRLEMCIAWGPAAAAPIPVLPLATGISVPALVPQAAAHEDEGFETPRSNVSSPEKGLRALAKYSMLDGGLAPGDAIPAKRANPSDPVSGVAIF